MLKLSPDVEKLLHLLLPAHNVDCLHTAFLGHGDELAAQRRARCALQQVLSSWHLQRLQEAVRRHCTYTESSHRSQNPDLMMYALDSTCAPLPQGFSSLELAQVAWQIVLMHTPSAQSSGPRQGMGTAEPVLFLSDARTCTCMPALVLLTRVDQKLTGRLICHTVRHWNLQAAQHF